MISLTMRQLQVFVAIVESGSFAGAARRLGIAQPSVSAHVRAIEQEAGGALFERQSGRQAVLSDLGRTFLGHARELLDQALKLESELGARASNQAQSVAFACQRSLANTVLRPAIANFVRDHREVRVSTRIAFQEEVIAAVRMGAADIGCLLSDEDPPGLSGMLIGRQRFVVFASVDHPLAGRAQVSAAALSDHDFVGPVPSSLFGAAQKRMLAGVGVQRMNVVAEATEFGPVRDLALEGLGLAVALEASVAEDVSAGRVRIIDLDAPPLLAAVRLLFNPQRRNAQGVQLLARHLRQAASGWE